MMCLTLSKPFQLGLPVVGIVVLKLEHQVRRFGVCQFLQKLLQCTVDSLNICFGGGGIGLVLGQGAHRVGVGATEVDFPAEGRDQVTVRRFEDLPQRGFVQCVGVHGSGRGRVGNALLERPSSIGSVSQGLNDDAFSVHQNDVPVSKHLYVQRSLAVFGVKGEGEDAVKTDLPDTRQTSVAKVFAQHHGKGRWRHWHRSVAFGGVDALTTYEHEVALVGFLGVDTEHDLLVVRHVGLLDVGALEGVQLPRHRTEVKAGHRLLHGLTRMDSNQQDDMKVSCGLSSLAPTHSSTSLKRSRTLPMFFASWMYWCAS